MSPSSVTPQLVEQCLAKLTRHGFDVSLSSTVQEANQRILSHIVQLAPHTVSYGHSDTLSAMGILNSIAQLKDITLLNGFDPTLTSEERLQIRRQGLTADLFLSGINAISADGVLFWMDKVGNRVAPIAFGPEHVILVASTHKIVADIASAQERLRQVAPQNAQLHPNYTTPCQKTGQCCDCNSPDRFCNVALTLNRSFPPHRIAVFLIDEALGLCGH